MSFSNYYISYNIIIPGYVFERSFNPPIELLHFHYSASKVVIMCGSMQQYILRLHIFSNLF
uniref:Uncharacterized protein n=1 Tax=Arundo donax TaxID=35708 RepID=A0A0A9C070_ARUDO